MSTESAYKIQRATSRAIVKKLALQWAKDTRHHPFTRVSADFLDDVEARTCNLIRRKVDECPSRGKTLS